MIRPLLRYAIVICACGAFAWSASAESLAREAVLADPSEAERIPVDIQALTVPVNAKEQWQATPLTATVNQTIILTVVAGQWTHWVGTQPYNNGVGGNYICGNPGCVEPLPTVATGALIGRIGSQVFAVRNGATIVAQQSGLLSLRINDGDDGLSDNDGVLSVQIVPTTDFIFLPSIVKAAPIPVVTKTVFAVAYMDASPLNEPADLQRQLISDLRNASTWHRYENPEGRPALEYQTYAGEVFKLNEAPPYRAENGKFDYAAVYARFDLCAKIQAGTVDEVWIWESGSGHAWEWVISGPYWSWVLDSNVPNCGRTVTTMNLNYQREVDQALHSYGHRLEATFMTWRPCDLFAETWPLLWGASRPSTCSGLASDQFAYIARPFTGNNHIGVCGDIHHPPNILDSREYVYDDQTAVNSICDDWHWTGNTTVKNFNCGRWECAHRGFLIWWMQNIPGFENRTRDRNGNPMPNWWGYLFRDQTPLSGLDWENLSGLEKKRLMDYFFHEEKHAN